MEVQVAVAKIEKYSVGESGDTVEVVERPHGGVSVVLVDGQRSGQSAKAISNLVARKAISLLAEGVRDGAAARAAHDYLRTQRGGKVSAELVMVSADFETGSIVLSRNSRTPILLQAEGAWRLLDTMTEAVGVHARTRPCIEEVPLRPDVVVIAMSDGVWTAGERRGVPIDLLSIVQDFPPALSAKTIADEILSHALRLEDDRPGDDLTVVVLHVISLQAHNNIRRMNLTFPIPSRIYGTWD